MESFISDETLLGVPAPVVPADPIIEIPEADQPEQDALPQDDFDPDDLSDLNTEASPTPIPDELFYTDLGNAMRFVRDHRENLRYCAALKKWMVWNGRQWAPDITSKISECVHLTYKTMRLEAGAMTDAEKGKKLYNWAVRSESIGHIQAMEKLARTQPGISIQPDDFDQNPLLFNCQNVTIELDKKIYHLPKRSDLISKISPVDFDHAADCPEWEKFLDIVTGHNTELQAYLRRAVGYSLSGSTKEHCLFMLYGTGANGKSTFLETIRHLFGNYASSTDFNSLMVSKDDRVRNDIARLCGARFVTASESEDGRRLDEPLVKQLTGADTVTARHLYSEHFEFIPQFKLWLASNYKPTIRGTDDGIWRRLRLIPFTVSIPRDQQDRDLSAKLRAEASGILNWAIQGLLDYLQNGLGNPAVIEEAVAEYRQDQDVVAYFINAQCTLGPFTIGSRPLYTVYKKWALDNGEYVMSERAFSFSLAKRGLRKSHTSKGAFWHGIAASSSSPAPTAPAVYGTPDAPTIPASVHTGSNSLPIESIQPNMGSEG